MERPTQPIRSHHASIMTALRSFYEFLKGLESMEGKGESEELNKHVHFLTDDLLPHAEGEEKALYPAVEPLLKAHGSATASMSMDHAHLKRLISDLAEKGWKLTEVSDEEAVILRKEMIRLGYQIYGILGVHFAKEEDIYLELMDRHMSPKQVREVVHKMHHHH